MGATLTSLVIAMVGDCHGARAAEPPLVILEGNTEATAIA